MVEDFAAEKVERSRGHYLGTEIDHRWWRRYRAESFGWRGNGEFWFTDDALVFRKILSKAPIRISLSTITGAKLGTWHAGKWLAGRSIVKVDWRDSDDLDLSSGFGFGNRELAQRFIHEVRRRTGIA